MATKNAAISSKKTSTVKKPTTVEATTGKKDSVSVVAKYEKLCDSLQSRPIVGAMIAEFIGTFMLTAAFLEMQSSPLFVAFAFIGIILVVGGVSGAHLNPATTIGAWVTGKIKGARAIAYIVAQFIGAGIALLVLNSFLGAVDTSSSYSTASIFSAATISGSEWYLFFAELLGATILSLGVATGLSKKRNKIAYALTAGLSMLVALYIAMSLSTVLLTESYTGFTFLNPAIAFAANGLSWNIWPIAIFILAPVLGGIIGFALQTLMQHSQATDESECDCTC